MSTLFHIADRVLNRPLLISRDKAEVVLSVLAGRIGVDAAELSRFEGSPIERDELGRPVRMKPYNVTDDGVAIITITGSLVNRGAWIGASSGLTSYEGIQHQLKTAGRDPKVRAVILDLHTPGGEATGCFETAAAVRALAAEKRTVAVVNGVACSGGYLIASGASEIVTTESGQSGSIGVVRLHADFSQHLAKEGIKPTLIIAGAHKADGNPFEPLPDEVREDWQAEVATLYDLFLTAVAAGRGERTSVEAARATEARVYMGHAAVAAHLCDRVGTFDQILSELSRATPQTGGRSTVQQRSKSMDNQNGAPAAEASAGNATTSTSSGQGFSQAQLDAAVKTASENAAKAERDRIAGIEANLLPGHESLIAQHKADPAMTPERSALAILAAEKAKPQDVRTGLQQLDKAAAGVESRPSATGDSGTPPAAKATTPDGWKAEWEASDALKAEYPTVESYVATKKREAGRGG